MDELDKRYPDNYDEAYWDDMVAHDLLWFHNGLKWDIESLDSIEQVSIKYKTYEELGEKAAFIADVVGQIKDVYKELQEAIWDLYQIAK